MGRFDELKEKYPRGMVVVQGLLMIIVSTIITLLLIAPIYIFDIDGQVLIDVFTYPTDIIPQPFNLIGILFLPIGMVLVIWANYTLLHIGKIGLRNREPMQRPSSLVLVGPYRFTRNPIYLGVLMMAVGMTIVWSGLVMLIVSILVFIIFRYKFIKREEVILEDEFGDEYREFKNRVRRWI
jgi:protein-S-isoprenylcysteine O-methyltransferase Ste14